MRASFSPRFAVLCALALLAIACKREPAAGADVSAVIAAADSAQTPVDKTAMPGIDVSGLPADKQDAFYRLAAQLTSPCGKAHSLRTSVTTDTSCRRAAFAARYIAALLSDGEQEKTIVREYESKYTSQAISVEPGQAPKHGIADAPVKLVEFFDYGCPACQGLRPELEKAVSAFPNQATVYYKMFPLEAAHPDSRSAACAALAADAQGKFHEMHDLLYTRKKHQREDVIGYARELGLDLTKFEADYTAANAKVDADQAQGEKVGVKSTPTLFIGGVRYTGPFDDKYIAMWIEEEIAVNR